MKKETADSIAEGLPSIHDTDAVEALTHELHQRAARATAKRIHDLEQRVLHLESELKRQKIWPF